MRQLLGKSVASLIMWRPDAHMNSRMPGPRDYGCMFADNMRGGPAVISQVERVCFRL